MDPLPMLRGLLAAEPFKPFLLCLSDGRRLPVSHPEALLISGRGQFIVWEGEKDGDFALSTPLHVTGVENLPGRRRRRAA
jgi:hypothetical protein